MIWVLTAASSAMFSLTTGCRPAGRWMVVTAPHPRRRAGTRSLHKITARSSQEFAGTRHVLADSSDERIEGVEPHLRAQVVGEVQRQPLAIEIAVEVQHVRLDPALLPGEGRIRTDRPRGGPPTRPPD